MSEKIYPVAVIGGGAAGTMATLRAALNNDEVIFFPGNAKDKKRSRAMWVSKVENIPGLLKYRKGIEEPNQESLNWLHESEFKQRFHWQKNRGIVEIKKQGEIFELTDSKGEQYKARYVILCTGVMDVQPLINGSIKDILPYANLQTADYCLRCDGHHIFEKDTAIIGHGTGAAWVAIMLYERYSCLTCHEMSILTNGEKPDFSADVVKLLETYKIPVYEEPIVQILGDPKAGKLEGFQLESGKVVNVSISFVSLGMIVYNELAKQLGADLDERGFVSTDVFGETNIGGFYVAGDLRANTRKQIYDAHATAVTAADHINGRIRTKRREKRLNS